MRITEEQRTKAQQWAEKRGIDSYEIAVDKENANRKESEVIYKFVKRYLS